MPSAKVTSKDTVLVVGDGPTGLSAALFLAKNGLRVDVIGYNETPVHKADLHNYLGVEVTGPDFLEKARAQAEQHGARLHQGWVERIETGTTFKAHLQEGGGAYEGAWLVLATGFDADVAGSLGLATSDEGAIAVDLHGRTSLDHVYAGGSLTRGQQTQVATGVGDGVAIALDILSRVKGKPFHDYDVVKKKAATSAR